MSAIEGMSSRREAGSPAVRSRVLSILVVLGALLGAACGARDERTPAAPAANPAPAANSAPAAGSALLTIPFAPTARCAGGSFFIDGIAHGRYPVRRQPVPAGRHVVKIWSDGDCAGYGNVEVELPAGVETVLEPSRFR